MAAGYRRAPPTRRSAEVADRRDLPAPWWGDPPPRTRVCIARTPRRAAHGGLRSRGDRERGRRGRRHGPTSKVALVLAERKAASVAERLGRDTDAVVVGCDSVLEVGGETRGKPRTTGEARAWWRSVAGRTAVLHSGHCVIDLATGSQASAVASTTVRYGTPTAAEMDAYLATEEPLAVAGGFTIDGYAAP